MDRQDNFVTFLHVTVITDLAPQAAEANRGGPGAIKINEFMLVLVYKKRITFTEKATEELLKRNSY